jgi:hypothetical protein
MNREVAMDTLTIGCRGAGRLLFSALALLSLAQPVLARPPQDAHTREDAAKVARKVEKAKKAAARQTKEEAETIRHFQKAAAKYAEVHDSQVGRIKDQSAVTAQALADGIRARRDKARQGDIFIPEVQPLLKRLIAEQLKGPDAVAAREAIADGNPTQEADSPKVVLKVNALYPAGAPRSTVPPSLLLALPPLPKCLHYRFVGRDLVLVDAVSQIIADFLPAAAPVATVK